MEVRGKLTKIKQALGFCDYLLLRREGQLFLINTFVSHVRGRWLMFVTSLKSYLAFSLNLTSHSVLVRSLRQRPLILKK